MRSTGHAWSYKAWCSAVISCFSTTLIGAFRSLLIRDLLPRRSAVTRLSCCCVFWSWKSSVNCLFDLARVVIRVTINELYFVPEWLVSGVVGMLWNGGGLGTGESDVSIVLLNSVLNRSSSLSDVHLAAFTGNPVNYTILFSRVDSVLWSY